MLADAHDSPLTFERLGTGERWLWQGRPPQGVRLQAADAFVIPFSLLWCGFAVFWEFSVVSSGAPFFLKLWGVPFVVVGLYMVVGRFFVEARVRARTFFGVTNERIVIVSGLFASSTKSLSLRTLSDVTLTERANGGGTISFGPQHPMASRVPAGWPGAGAYAAPAFVLSEGARAVYEIIREAQKAAR